MRCHNCGCFNEQGEWPDGERWCRAVLKKKPLPMALALCPDCCGKKECTAVVIVIKALFETN